MKHHVFLCAFVVLFCGHSLAAEGKPDSVSPRRVENLLLLENGTVKIGVNRAMGGAITWLSWAAHPQNTVNSVDPGKAPLGPPPRPAPTAHRKRRSAESTRRPA